MTGNVCQNLKFSEHPGHVTRDSSAEAMRVCSAGQSCRTCDEVIRRVEGWNVIKWDPFLGVNQTAN